MSDHRYDIRISESCVDPNSIMVERQDPDNFTRFQTRERCALEIAAYVFKVSFWYLLVLYVNFSVKCLKFAPKLSLILAAIFVTIATVKVKSIIDFYTWLFVLINV